MNAANAESEIDAYPVRWGRGARRYTWATAVMLLSLLVADRTFFSKVQADFFTWAAVLIFLLSVCFLFIQRKFPGLVWMLVAITLPCWTATFFLLYHMVLAIYLGISAPPPDWLVPRPITAEDWARTARLERLHPDDFNGYFDLYLEGWEAPSTKIPMPRRMLELEINIIEGHYLRGDKERAWKQLDRLLAASVNMLNPHYGIKGGPDNWATPGIVGSIFGDRQPHLTTALGAGTGHEEELLARLRALRNRYKPYAQEAIARDRAHLSEEIVTDLTSSWEWEWSEFIYNRYPAHWGYPSWLYKVINCLSKSSQRLCYWPFYLPSYVPPSMVQRLEAVAVPMKVAYEEAANPPSTYLIRTSNFLLPNPTGNMIANGWVYEAEAFVQEVHKSRQDLDDLLSRLEAKSETLGAGSEPLENP